MPWLSRLGSSYMKKPEVRDRTAVVVCIDRYAQCPAGGTKCETLRGTPALWAAVHVTTRLHSSGSRVAPRKLAPPA